jgi:C4-type Zn-finger protein
LEHPEDWQPEKQAQVPFQGAGIKINTSAQKCNYTKFELNSSEDPELSYAIKMSIESKFQSKVENGLTIAFAMPEGKQIQHTFDSRALIEVDNHFIALGYV